MTNRSIGMPNGLDEPLNRNIFWYKCLDTCGSSLANDVLVVLGVHAELGKPGGGDEKVRLLCDLLLGLLNIFRGTLHSDRVVVAEVHMNLQ